MNTDVGLPIQMIGKDRDEILLVYFDGFIKNETECMIRTMLQEVDVWKERYPGIIDFIGLTRDELYHETMLFRPNELLSLLSENKLGKSEIENDLETIIPNILFAKSKITSFEFALYQILQENNIKACYIFKNDNFYENEIKYIKKQYKEVIGKIQFVSGGLLTLFDDIKPTTLFITDPSLPIEIFPHEYSREQLDDKLFILLNSSHNIQYDETDKMFYYTEDFSNRMKDINENSSYGLLAMFNFPLKTDLEENDGNDNGYIEEAVYG